MIIKEIMVYYNTSGTTDGTDAKWFDRCRAAGGPKSSTTCSVDDLLEEENDSHNRLMSGSADTDGGSDGKGYMAKRTLVALLLATAFAFSLF